MEELPIPEVSEEEPISQEDMKAEEINPDDVDLEKAPYISLLHPLMVLTALGAGRKGDGTEEGNGPYIKYMAESDFPMLNYIRTPGSIKPYVMSKQDLFPFAHPVRGNIILLGEVSEVFQAVITQTHEEVKAILGKLEKYDLGDYTYDHPDEVKEKKGLRSEQDKSRDEFLRQRPALDLFRCIMTIFYEQYLEGREAAMMTVARWKAWIRDNPDKEIENPELMMNVCQGALYWLNCAELFQLKSFLFSSFLQEILATFRFLDPEDQCPKEIFEMHYPTIHHMVKGANGGGEEAYIQRYRKQLMLFRSLMDSVGIPENVSETNTFFHETMGCPAFLGLSKCMQWLPREYQTEKQTKHQEVVYENFKEALSSSELEPTPVLTSEKLEHLEGGGVLMLAEEQLEKDTKDDRCEEMEEDQQSPEDAPMEDKEEDQMKE